LPCKDEAKWMGKNFRGVQPPLACRGDILRRCTLHPAAPVGAKGFGHIPGGRFLEETGFSFAMPCRDAFIRRPENSAKFASSSRAARGFWTCDSPPASPRHRHPMRTGQDLTVPRHRRRDADRSNRSRASRCTACSCSGSCSLHVACPPRPPPAMFCIQPPFLASPHLSHISSDADIHTRMPCTRAPGSQHCPLHSLLS